MPRVLFLMTTATYRASAFLAAARAVGAEAVVGTERPQALASLHPQGHVALPFDDLAAAMREIEAFARRHPLDAVISADDEGSVLAATAAEALGLPHAPPGAVRSARSKLATRAAFARAGLPSPRFEPFETTADPNEVARRVEYPCVLKPLFMSASRGVIRANHTAELIPAFRRIAALLGRPEVQEQGGEEARSILVEGYVPGIEVAAEGLVTRGRARVLAILDKPDPLEGPYFEETLYVTPSRLPAVRQGAIAATLQRAIDALGLDHGPVHAELRLNDQGIWPLEIAPRSIGGLCSRALRFGEGGSLEELILMHALGRDVASIVREPRASGVMMIPIPRAGILQAVGGIEDALKVRDIEDVRITIPLGQALVPLPEGSRYLGFVFARAQSPARVEAALREAHRRLKFEIEPAPAGAVARNLTMEGVNE